MPGRTCSWKRPIFSLSVSLPAFEKPAVLGDGAIEEPG